MTPFLSAVSVRLRKLPALVLLFSVAVSCRSAQPAYLFQPAGQTTHVAPALPTSPAVAPEAAELAPPISQPRQATTPRTRRALLVRRPRQFRQVYAQAVRAGMSLPLKTTSIQKARSVAAPKHGAEVGLGTTVLGVLGLVVLPVALLGLLIWGGPVWAILAGLAALAVLVAYLDPFA